MRDCACIHRATKVSIAGEAWRIVYVKLLQTETATSGTIDSRRHTKPLSTISPLSILKNPLLLSFLTNRAQAAFIFKCLPRAAQFYNNMRLTTVSNFYTCATTDV